MSVDRKGLLTQCLLVCIKQYCGNLITPMPFLISTLHLKHGGTLIPCLMVSISAFNPLAERQNWTNRIGCEASHCPPACCICSPKINSWHTHQNPKREKQIELDHLLSDYFNVATLFYSIMNHTLCMQTRKCANMILLKVAICNMRHMK